MTTTVEQGKAAGLAIEMGNMKTLDMDRLAKAYLKIREARADANREAKRVDDEFKEKLKLIQNAVLDFFNQTNQQSSRTKSGTFYKVLDIQPTSTNWQEFYDWIKEHDAFDFLEKRIKKTEVANYMESHNGDTPPGVSVLKEFEIRLRQGD